MISKASTIVFNCHSDAMRIAKNLNANLCGFSVFNYVVNGFLNKTIKMDVALGILLIPLQVN